MAWYPQVRECCGLGGESFRVSGPVLVCVWAVGMASSAGSIGPGRAWPVPGGSPPALR